MNADERRFTQIQKKRIIPDSSEGLRFVILSGALAKRRISGLVAQEILRFAQYDIPKRLTEFEICTNLRHLRAIPMLRAAG
jgi:hypothetical protein